MKEGLISLDTKQAIWQHCFTVAPLVVIGTREGEGFNLAPKHMVTPLGWDNYFGFVCARTHRTYQNIRKKTAFTVSFPNPDNLVVASLAAMPRCEGPIEKPVLDQIPTFPASNIDGVFMDEGYLFLACTLDRIIDGFGPNSLIAGKIVEAYVRPEVLRVTDGDEQQQLFQFPLLAYVAPGRWAEIRETNHFPYPTNFKL